MTSFFTIRAKTKPKYVEKRIGGGLTSPILMMVGPGRCVSMSVCMCVCAAEEEVATNSSSSNTTSISSW